MSQAEETTYEGEMSFEDAVRQASTAIDEHMAEVDKVYATTDDSPAEEPVAETQEAQLAADEQPDASSEAGTEPATAEATAEPEDKALVRLVQREAALEARRAKLEEREAALKAMESRVTEFDHWKEDFQADPVGFIRENLPDLDLASTAEQLWYGQDPSKAPVHYRALQEARAARREAMKARRGGVKAPEAPAGEEQAGAEAETAFNQYLGAMRSYTESVDAEAYPLVARFAKKHGPERAYQAAFSHAQRVAQETNGERVLTPAEAAAALEKELKSLQLSDEPVEESPKSPVTTQAAQTPPTSIRNSHTQVQSDRRPPEETEEYLRYKALKDIGYDEARARQVAGYKG